MRLGDVFILLICPVEAHRVAGCSWQPPYIGVKFSSRCVGFCSCPDPTNVLALVKLFALTERLSGAEDTPAGWALTDTCLQEYTVTYSHSVLLSPETL